MPSLLPGGRWGRDGPKSHNPQSPSPAFIFCGNLTQPEAIQGFQHTIILLVYKRRSYHSKGVRSCGPEPGMKSKYTFLFIPHHSNIEIWP